MSALFLLLLACLAILVGPLLSLVSTRMRALRALIDGFSLVLVAGICLLVVLPHVLAHLGPVGLGLAALGLALPALSHRLGGGARWTMILLLLALVIHVLLDGAVLSHGGHSEHLGWAVVAHRLPAGFAIALAAQKSKHAFAWTWSAALAVIAATLVGFWVGPELFAALPHEGAEGFEAFVAGVLLHVAFSPDRYKDQHAHCTHGHHDHSHDEGCRGHEHDAHQLANHGHRHADGEVFGHNSHDDRTEGAPSGHRHAEKGRAHEEHYDHHHSHDEHCDHHHADNALHHLHHHDHGSSKKERLWATLGALAGGWLLLSEANIGHAEQQEGVSSFLQTLGVLLLESAPALLLGYTLAGVIPFILTPARSGALARGNRLSQALRGVLFGLPLPVCSCGVLPLYESLIRKGAPATAALAFFVATPELGLDALLLSMPLLGSSLTIARITAAFFVAMLVAMMMGGAKKLERPQPENDALDAQDLSWQERVQEGLRFGFVEVFDHTMPWIAVGLIVAALAEPMLSHSAIGDISPFLQVPLAALIGVPIYVCASGATPIAAIAIHKGVSAGAAIAFLIAGPATNVTTFGVLSRLHSRRTALIFGLSVAILSIFAGWIVDALEIPAAQFMESHPHVEGHGSLFAWICLGLLVLLSVASLLRQGPRGALGQIFNPIHSH